MKRGEIYWADLGDGDRRPALVVTRDAAIPVRTRVTVAPITRTVRDHRFEVPLGPEDGLPVRCAANCDNLTTIEKRRLDKRASGRLAWHRLRDLDAAIVWALGIDPAGFVGLDA